MTDLLLWAAENATAIAVVALVASVGLLVATFFSVRKLRSDEKVMTPLVAAQTVENVADATDMVQAKTTLPSAPITSTLGPVPSRGDDDLEWARELVKVLHGVEGAPRMTGDSAGMTKEQLAEALVWYSEVRPPVSNRWRLRTRYLIGAMLWNNVRAHMEPNLRRTGHSSYVPGKPKRYRSTSSEHAPLVTHGGDSKKR